MAPYRTEAEALADGFAIEHREAEHRFVVVHDSRIIGHAHYTLIGEEGINFDGTFVDPSHRGTGLSALLVARALADDVVAGKTVRASCWYVADHIEAHPDSLAEGATYDAG